MPARNTLVQL